jgi:lipopolysaccharide transport system ATP-binding protein
MEEVVLKIDNVSKQYRLGLVGTGTLIHDLNRWWHLIRGKEDPYLQIGDVNDREKYGGDYVWALQDISFEVNKGDIIGIIGKNGAGKSTLLKLLSQVTGPTTGSINIKGRIAALLEVGTGFHPELTGRENIFLNGAILGMTKEEINAKIDEIIDFSGVAKYIDTPVKRYSSGMMVRLGFAVAAHLEPEILVVDEVLAVGDAEFQKKCLGKMKDVAGEGRTVIFVSHNMASIRNLCQKGVVLSKGEISFSGDVEDAISAYLCKNVKSSDQLESKVNETDRLINTGEAKVTEIQLINSSNKADNKLAYQERFTIRLALDIFKKIENINLSIEVVTKFGESVSYGYSSNNRDLLSFDVGKYEIEFKLPIDLMPGDYALATGISNFYTGASIDYIEYFYPFQVDKTTISGNFEYPWATVRGYVEMSNNWNISKLN